jgi:hypothetical protein
VRADRFAPLALALLAAGPALRAAGSFEFRSDISQAPDLAAHAAQSKALCEEWYPKINEILFGADHPLPYGGVEIVFAPQQLAGYTHLNVIHISSDWLRQPHELDWRAVVIHELAHVNQDYALHLRCDGWRAVPCFIRIRLPEPNRRLEWLGEGIADYVTYTYFTKTNEPRLHLDKNGYLTGYTDSIPYLFGLQRYKVRLGPQGYRHGYTVASAFLLWLERRKDKEIVRRLNVAMNQRHAAAGLFRRYCGAALDELWGEFMAQSMPAARLSPGATGGDPAPSTPPPPLAPTTQPGNSENAAAAAPSIRPE